MKKKLVKKLLAGALASVLALGTLAGCGGSTSGNNGGAASGNSTSGNSGTEAGGSAEGGSAEDSGAAPTAGGTILWLANMSSGIQYDAAKAYAEDLCGKLGYSFKVVYGDSFNDPAGNLKAVQDAMTSDVVGLISSQDGGTASIMETYPELYVAGYNAEMLNVFGEGGESAACLTNDHYLGTIADGHIDGADLGKQMFDAVVEKGYKKVATINFPVYAYPNLTAGDQSFRALVEEYNEGASEPIEVVGEVKTLEFAPLDESWFLESGNGDLDAVVALCAGCQFVYPTMVSAIANGSCSANTKLITSGFTDDAALVADIGGDGIIQMITISPVENIGWSIWMLHKAITGTMYEDWTGAERFDSIEYVIDSKEDIDNVMSKALNGTRDTSLAQLTLADLEGCSSYADLRALMLSDQLAVDALAGR